MSRRSGTSHVLGALGHFTLAGVILYVCFQALMHLNAHNQKAKEEKPAEEAKP